MVSESEFVLQADCRLVALNLSGFPFPITSSQVQAIRQFGHAAAAIAIFRNVLPG